MYMYMVVFSSGGTYGAPREHAPPPKEITTLCSPPNFPHCAPLPIFTLKYAICREQ